MRDSNVNNSGIKIALAGNPNVGKSVLFHALTGRYATVSNYPGTTVDVSHGKIVKLNATLIDTPGMHSLVPVTEEEKIARRILLDSDLVVHVMDAKNVERMLPFTLQLIEAGFSVVLVLNAVDEAERYGIEINEVELSRRLGIPVVKTIATQRKGISELRKVIGDILSGNMDARGKRRINFSQPIERHLSTLEMMIKRDYGINRRVIAILALLGDDEIVKSLRGEENYERIVEHLREIRTSIPSLPYEIQREIHENAKEILAGVLKFKEEAGVGKKLSDISLNPYFSIPMAAASLLFIYFFAGVVGAQILVDFIDTYFERFINTPLNEFLERNVPEYWIRELIGGDYGIVTLGLRYAVAIVFPIVTTFFIAFSLLEDSGFLPRLSYLLDSFFKKIGLSGRAVIPLVLGTGCGTMATIVTRTLESRRERLIATLLLAVGIPCSAQLGVMIGIAPDLRAFSIWMIVVTFVLLTVGTVSSRIIPGNPPLFFMEIPPLRMPSPRNTIYKTVSRLEWYVKEVTPIFVMISLAIWIGRITLVFDAVIAALSIPSQVIGLPAEASKIFLYGFFRRDYGAAGLYDLAELGLMNYSQTIVAMVTLTLFVPCIAQFSVMCKERGLKTGVAIFMVSLTVAFLAGYLTNLLLSVVM
jgi:ferrous iron transport protein B